MNSKKNRRETITLFMTILVIISCLLLLFLFVGGSTKDDKASSNDTPTNGDGKQDPSSDNPSSDPSSGNNDNSGNSGDGGDAKKDETYDLSIIAPDKGSIKVERTKEDNTKETLYPVEEGKTFFGEGLLKKNEGLTVTFSVPENFSLTSYTLTNNGNVVDSTYSTTVSFTVSGDVVIKDVKLQGAKGIVTLHFEGGKMENSTDSVQVVGVEEGSEYTWLPTYEGYKFGGWHTKKLGNGTSVGDKESGKISSWDSENYGSDLYASWYSEADGSYYYTAGSYPQTALDKDTDAALIEALEKDENGDPIAKPDSTNDNGWTSYDYYYYDSTSKTRKNDVHFMWYLDKEYEGEKYRGIYFIYAKPTYPNQVLTTEPSNDQYPYNDMQTIYWFKFEPISWKAVDAAQGFLISDIVLDSQAYYHCIKDSDYPKGVKEDGETHANDWETSDLKGWLEDFKRVSELDDDVEVSLLRNADASNWRYSNAMEHVGYSDYANSQGLYKWGDYANYWWLFDLNKTIPYTSYANVVEYSNNEDYDEIKYRAVDQGEIGVRPTLTIDVSYDYKFGDYPQSKVTDSEVIGELEKDENGDPIAKPDSTNDNGWTSYDFYIDRDNKNKFMWYIDKDYDGDTYRGVYFTQYRPNSITNINEATAENSYQDDNGYMAETIYWFKYEPIEWTVYGSSSNTDGTKSLNLVTKKLLDAQNYSFEDRDNSVSSSNSYQWLSTLRTWLLNEFYNSFSADEQGKIQTSSVLVDYSTAELQPNGRDNNYISSKFTECVWDKIFLLSYSEYNKGVKYFRDDDHRMAQGTDYAKCLGLFVDSDGYSSYWTRSPAYTSYQDLSVISSSGKIERDKYYNTYLGVRPATTIKI